ncbi:hypothetical protein OHB26_00440 [Nocardia sp. NBC_01503]|uniref:hypothetical protein n=1 Tax=Nocardia sp. NBC_01503 TaxID=2975997 RepID=UPI002E7BCD0E|nr:hypothetical protein [Nocardia sp. NBC_01503]WTL32780.1 hypothetical protein OHB26_00440 [Nocardia sp. NBC_01503]
MFGTASAMNRVSWCWCSAAAAMSGFSPAASANQFVRQGNSISFVLSTRGAQPAGIGQKQIPQERRNRLDLGAHAIDHDTWNEAGPVTPHDRTDAGKRPDPNYTTDSCSLSLIANTTPDGDQIPVLVGEPAG